ncbi:MAG: hypothetical protein L0Y58_17855 [Verrucomicrobia subdivision 3 bacterium]|nr:hypothetical protein [Limisphaerales bacterium]
MSADSGLERLSAMQLRFVIACASVCVSVSGGSGAEAGMERGMKPKRNARRRAADGSPPLLRPCTMEARDERAVCEVEWTWSRGGKGRPAGRGTKQNRTLVTVIE